MIPNRSSSELEAERLKCASVTSNMTINSDEGIKTTCAKTLDQYEQDFDAAIDYRYTAGSL